MLKKNENITECTENFNVFRLNNTKSCNSNAVAGFWGRIFSLSEFWKSFSELGPYLASCHNGIKYFCNFTFWLSFVTLWSHENMYESLKHQASTFLLVVQPYIEQTQTFYLPKKNRVKFDPLHTSFFFFCYLLSILNFYM